MAQCGIAVCDKGSPWPADCALPWAVCGALNASDTPSRDTGEWLKGTAAGASPVAGGGRGEGLYRVRLYGDAGPGVIAGGGKD
jgi:hypothetical protein